MELMMPTDAIFLLGESREHPMHVGGLQLFEPPPGAGRGFARELHKQLTAQREFQPTFRKHPAKFVGGIANLGWSYDDDIDVDYHVRRSALPSPKRVRELLELTSRWHSTLLDRHRPLWETHIVEGLKDGRFAIYTKVHHALIDGVSAQKLMQRALSTDPDDPEIRAPWSLSKPKRRSSPSSRLGSVARAAGSVAALAPSTVGLARAALLEQQLTLPFGAPKTMLNVKIGGARRCAAQSWSLDRIKSVKRAAGVTVNDVVLAMCSGALRYYLLEQNALPDTPLIAMVPVSLRTEEEADAGGNMVGAILCNLATDTDDPAQRLLTISDSMCSNKKVFSQLPRLQALALSAVNTSALALAAVPGWVASTSPPFNIIISNVPGPTQPIYYGGARLDGNYPLSIALDGQALNITLASNAGNLDFGLVGCRRSVPHLQRLLAHLESSLKDLERAVGE
ncbi:WS/DGAT/MGAT family O-acyltransferase [Mycobacterium intracellulare]|uniref:Diacylglycerol O-acyltransferase n=1 Tax=Mycobacterium intracellulare (strain ATCC 13950 / DSM 43223 / JCM 6384 / NCTC 13025 / 3600) TaxID=487521 RepID=H8ILR3_MYCIA|nr:wax ester/triacylglycerol synthase family O-acyltransferase [Mycobacterium intracellulare]AFC41535.1 wax ester synthase/acyl-coadiacylglycerol acyltransferase [Mycobacterium intracellulare ATCC 13950]ETZ40181.1 putative diacylglycerol O-acyltransferase tgs2 [Mycobacterium intracellulare MIN_061107_1834]MCA2248988.1 wax ester/triacylglycerol synthase family O-acyltransferase [Mycobacterium intracellulare]MCA2274575.1 wax ester/triacylglycerol synthase family O-acyltransferase [Mycobacterium i